MRPFLVKFCLIAGVLASAVGSARGAPIGYRFEGTIRRVDGIPPRSTAAPGTPFSGQVVYDPAALPTEPTSRHLFAGSASLAVSVDGLTYQTDPTALELSIGTFPVLLDPNSGEIIPPDENFPDDPIPARLFSAQSDSNEPVGGHEYALSFDLLLEFEQLPGIPRTASTLGPVIEGSGSIGVIASGFSLAGSIERVVVIPEPSPLAMIALGLGVFCVAGRRARRA